jgi:hypothetical protein
MASILPVGSRWRAQVRQRGQSIAKTLKTKGAAEAWARKKEVEIDKGQNAVDAATVTVGDLLKGYREARAESDRAVKPKSSQPPRTEVRGLFRQLGMLGVDQGER